MQIRKIRFHNYRQYYGEQDIHVPEKGKFIIVRGENGAGKTNFINGLTWCLYNEKADLLELFNDKAINEAKINNNIVMSVAIHFEHKGETYQITRSGNATKNADSQPSIHASEYKLEIISHGKRTVETNELVIGNRINDILNESVKNYFFFDGAKIETFTKDDHYKDVEKATKNLLKIEAIKRARNHMDAIIKDITLSIKGDDDGGIEKIKTAILELDGNITISNETLKRQENDLQAIEKDISRTEKEIKNIEENSQYKERKKEIEEKRKVKNDLLDKCKEDLNQLLRTAYNCFTKRLIEDANTEVTAILHHQKEVLYFEALKHLIQQSIEKNKCHLCEDEMTETKKTLLREKLPKLIKDGTTYGNVASLSSSFVSLNKEGEQIVQRIADLMGHYNAHKKEKNDYDEQLNKLDGMIRDELPDISAHKTMMIKLKGRRDDTRDQITDLRKKITDIKKEKKNKETELDDKVKTMEKHKEEQKKLSLSYAIRDELELLYGNYENAALKDINRLTKQIFNLIIRKDNVFTEVFIDDQYKLNVKRAFSDNNIIKQLSYGERQILSLSLILALAKSSSDQAPFVMDTPMGNLDPIHRQKLAANLPQFVDQLFLLVTSSEFTSDLYDLCSSNIAAIYDLTTVADGMTQITKGD